MGKTIAHCELDLPISLDTVSDFLNGTMVDRFRDAACREGAVGYTPTTHLRQELNFLAIDYNPDIP